MPLSTRPLCEHLGVEVTGVDLSQPLEPALATDIVRAVWDRQLLLFRGQDLSTERFERICFELGRPLWLSDAKPPALERDRIVDTVTNVNDDGSIRPEDPRNAIWHADYSFVTPPPGTELFSLLRAIKVVEGYDTDFVSLYTAYDTLSPQLRQEAEALGVIHDYAVGIHKRHSLSMDEINQRFGTVMSRVLPLVRTHPATGKKVLALSYWTVDVLVGLDEEEGSRLLDVLNAHATRPEVQYSHAWRPGDVLLWDNASINHHPPEIPRLPRLLEVARTFVSTAVGPLFDQVHRPSDDLRPVGA